MKRINNRRGQVFVISVVIAVTLALTSAYFLLQFMFEPKNDNEFLGSYQSGIVDALADGDKAFLYVDQAAKMAVNEALEEYLYGNPNTLTEEYASEDTRNYCGSYVYRLWNSENKDCYPDYSNSQTFELNSLISKHLTELNNLEQNKKAPLLYIDGVLKQNINYQYKYDASAESTNIYGYTNDKYIIDIFKDAATKNNPNIKTYLQTKGTYSGSLAWPLPNYYTISSCFGYRGDVGPGASTNHPGIDIPAPIDTPVVAAAPGTVEQILYPAWGKVIIDHGGGLKTDYIHMNKIADGLRVGDTVQQGQVIGYVGGRGANSANDYANASHLHFDVIGTNVNLDANYKSVSGIVKGSTGTNYVNPLCFIQSDLGSQSGTSELKLNINMASKACNSVCDANGRCANVKADEIPGGTPYKFCSSYEGVVTKEVPCPKSDKADWEIDKVGLSSTSLTSDQTLTITFSVINKGDVCVAIYTKPRLSNLLWNFDIDTKKSTNVYKTDDKKTSTNLDPITCTFSSDTTVIQKSIADGKCVLLAPDIDKTRTYTIQPAGMFVDYNDKKKDYTGPLLQFTVKGVASTSSIEEKLSAEYDNIKAKIKSLNLKPISSGDSVLIVAGTQPQKMYLVKENSKGVVSIEKTYDVSLAAKGFGDIAGSEMTPLGLHAIKEMIGDGVPIDTIFSSGPTPTNNVATIYTDNTNVATDYVLTRVMWLDGLESSNKNTHDRAIFIHGTAEEGLIGTPQSHGCIRMKNQDVIELFNLVKSGTYVDIVQSLSSSEAISSPTITLTNSEQATIDKTRKNLEGLGAMTFIDAASSTYSVPKEILLGKITLESAGVNQKINLPSNRAIGVSQVEGWQHYDTIQQVCGRDYVSECSSCGKTANDLKDCCRFEKFGSDVECQINVGADILKQFYDTYDTNDDAYAKAVRASCSNPKYQAQYLSYTGWGRALRAYNGFGCADLNAPYVETVMRYAAGWGYAGANDALAQDEANKGIFGTYDIKPSFNVKINFDMRLFDLLQQFSKDAVVKCGAEGIVNKKTCLQGQVDAFNKGLPQEYTSKVIGLGMEHDNNMQCDDLPQISAVNTFVEDINNCIASSDNACQCLFPGSSTGRIEDVKSSDASTIFTYDFGFGPKTAYLDYGITTVDGKLWQEKSVSMDNFVLYKDKDGKLIVGKSDVQQCNPTRNKFRFCLKTNYQYSTYDDTASGEAKISTNTITIPFALLIRDQIAPGPVNEIDSYNLQHAKNVVVLRWDKNKEADVTKYNIYLADDKTVFDRPTLTLKQSITPISVSSNPKNYEEYKSIDLDNPTCKLKNSGSASSSNSLNSGGANSDSVDYCIFEYTAVTKEDKEIKIELKPNQPYYVSGLNKFLYILNGSDSSIGLSVGKEKFVAITAVDIDGNEIDNQKDGQKIESGKNLISFTPEDRLEAGLTKITSAVLIDKNKALTVSWSAVKNYIDGTPIDSSINIKYSFLMSQMGSCPEELYQFSFLGGMPQEYSAAEGNQLDVSGYDAGDYCLAVSARTNDGQGFSHVFLKSLTIPPRS